MIQTELFNDPLNINTGAGFSENRTYRYYLWRIWDVEKEEVAFIGLNPSTADEIDNDPTITRCVNYAKAWGYGGLFMLNIFAFRATDPRRMKAALDPVGPDNDYQILRIAAKVGLIVAAWGNHGDFMDRSMAVRELLFHKDVYCLGTTKINQPKHPLYLRADLRPILYFGKKVIEK